MPRHHLRRLLALLLLPLVAAPLAVAPARAAQDDPPAPAQATPTRLPELRESEPNDTISAILSEDQADPVGPGDPAATKDWARTVRGAIGGSSDLDYYRFIVTRPASTLSLRLDNLAADYDLLLAGGAGVAEQGEGGLDGIADVGSQINAIGSQINAIGSQINAIGSQINAIGSQINAIGSQINAISASPGRAAESIETTIWLPGVYYVAVASAGGEFSDTQYTLEVELLGSALSPAPPAPEVALRGRPPVAPADEITTLYLYNSNRMAARYPGRTSLTSIAAIESRLLSLASAGPNPSAPFSSLNGRRELGHVLDIADLQPIGSNTRTISDVYSLWDTNQANPFYANYVAGLIDNVIEATTVVSGTSGPGAAFGLGSGTEPALYLPNLRYVVLVGGDDVLPFFRLPDLTTIANESDYLAYTNTLEGGLIDPALALGAALQSRTLLSDNPYGVRRPYRFPGAPLFAPRLAVGRLVETPDDIRSYLDYYYGNYTLTGDTTFTIDPVFNEGLGSDEAFVTGYDFLKDQAEELSRTLGLAGYTPDNGFVTPLINDSWTRTDLEREWFNGRLDTEFSASTPNNPFTQQQTPLSSLNAHFDHWQILPAQDSAGNFPAQRLFDPAYDTAPCGSLPCYPGYFGGTLSYSVGCHSGYNVMVSAMTAPFRSPLQSDAQRILTNLYSADFAQAQNRHAGNWIGNTGYGYGTLDGVDFSERLSVLLTEELHTEVTDPLSPTIYLGQSIGEALVNAKQRYLRNASSLGPYDAKAVQVMTLYGLPYIRYFGDSANLLAPPAEEGTPQEPPPAKRRTPVPTPAPSGLLERTIAISITIDPDDFRTIARTGSRVLDLAADDFKVTDSFVQAGFSPSPQLRVFENNQVGVPELPRFAYDISALNNAGSARLVVRDVQFIEGAYGAEAGFDPQITQIVTETDDPLVATDIEPSFAAGAGIWYPDKFFGFSSVGEGEEQRDQLVSAAAQFRADANGETGLLRPYSRMVFKVTYIDPAAAEAAATLADIDPPTIQSVRLEEAGGTSLQQTGAGTRVVVIADDGGEAGRLSVRANYVVGGTSWQSITFVQPSPSQAPNRWVAELPQLIGQVRVIISATDGAGNTSYYTAKGSFAPPRQPRLYLPMLLR